MIHYPSKAENITSAMLLNSELGEVNTTAQVSHVIEHYAPNKKIKTVYTYRTLEVITLCTTLCMASVIYHVGRTVRSSIPISFCTYDRIWLISTN